MLALLPCLLYVACPVSIKLFQATTGRCALHPLQICFGGLGFVMMRHTYSTVLSNMAPLTTDNNISCNEAKLAADTTKQWPCYPRSLHTPTHNTWQAAEQSVTSTAVTADDECCAGTLKYFGSNSTMTSRNCFCVPSVYERFTAGLVDVAVAEYFGVCT